MLTKKSRILSPLITRPQLLPSSEVACWEPEIITFIRALNELYLHALSNGAMMWDLSERKVNWINSVNWLLNSIRSQFNWFVFCSLFTNTVEGVMIAPVSCDDVAVGVEPVSFLCYCGRQLCNMLNWHRVKYKMTCPLKLSTLHVHFRCSCMARIGSMSNFRV